ncbi:hypothetical protein J8273_3456 [Carpediemonas membranifera]|uniref:Bromodomain associated domain-containing protein n=1 Tax=Carpediemonas membranifera TaxID=201153 RepID=A0A8J6E3K9_9EUKA|nr:hypothetical protein J8273_3456 [Carpediemonas membranifera]|eukprot:KAG9393322.1 hypothetical protein J8273_3456 [Carpediemonas membranifera]
MRYSAPTETDEYIQHLCDEVAALTAKSQGYTSIDRKALDMLSGILRKRLTACASDVHRYCQRTGRASAQVYDLLFYNPYIQTMATDPTIRRGVRATERVTHVVPPLYSSRNTIIRAPESTNRPASIPAYLPALPSTAATTLTLFQHGTGPTVSVRDLLDQQDQYAQALAGSAANHLLDAGKAMPEAERSVLWSLCQQSGPSSYAVAADEVEADDFGIDKIEDPMGAEMAIPLPPQRDVEPWDDSAPWTGVRGPNLEQDKMCAELVPLTMRTTVGFGGFVRRIRTEVDKALIKQSELLPIAPGQRHLLFHIRALCEVDYVTRSMPEQQENAPS